MPKFPKNTDYKMKGSKFYGLGNSSPAKVSDDAVVEAQAKLDKTQLDFREPGWTHLAKGIHEGAKGVLAEFAGKKKKEKESQDTNVQDIASENIEIEDDTLSGGPELGAGLS
jgi:hypothetical protein